MNARALGLLVSVAAMSSFADRTITIQSTYDGGTGKWVGDVVALTNALMTQAANDLILLEKGEYDLSLLENAPLYTGGYGHALLGLTQSGVQLVGATGNPRDVHLFAAEDTSYRICMITGECKVRNLTMSGGYAASTHIATYNYRTGGAICMSKNTAVVSNCVFYGNRASTRSGAIGGANGIYGNVWDSLFYENNGNGDGFATGQSVYHNCTFSNNQSSTESAGNYGASTVANARCYNCLFIRNRGNKCGGLENGTAVDCRFLFNKSWNAAGSQNWSNCGGGATRSVVCTNCYFYGNSAYRCGGAVRGGQIVNCQVISNCLVLADSADGHGGGVYEASLVENCLIASNTTVSANGGGLAGCPKVINTRILYNHAGTGGGAYNSNLFDCEIAHNVATAYADSDYCGAGGGQSGGQAVRCTFYDNASSATSSSVSNIVDCVIRDTKAGGKFFDRCVFADLCNTGKVFAVGNVVNSDGVGGNIMYAFAGVQTMRNSIVTNSVWVAGPGSYANPALFLNRSGGTSVENCTFADNAIYWAMRGCDTAAKFMRWINVASFGNRRSASMTSAKADVTAYESAYFVMTNCLYGSVSNRTEQPDGWADSGCVALGEGKRPSVIGKGEHPYTPKTSSPLVKNKGVRLDWMDDATDLAGNARLRDGKVDIGCYQCWLDPLGVILLLR